MEMRKVEGISFCFDLVYFSFIWQKLLFNKQIIVQKIIEWNMYNKNMGFLIDIKLVFFCLYIFLLLG